MSTTTITAEQVEDALLTLLEIARNQIKGSIPQIDLLATAIAQREARIKELELSLELSMSSHQVCTDVNVRGAAFARGISEDNKPS